MGWLKGGVTFQRFKVGGPKPRLFTDEHLGRLRERKAAVGVAAPAGDGVKTGWAGGGHCLDADFDEAKNVYPDHLLWDFWVETNKLPTDRLKAYYEADLKALARDNPSGHPTAEQKREARASARLRLEEQARDGRWKKWKCVPAAWDAIRNEVFFAATTTGNQRDRFASLFVQTFEDNLFQSPSHADKLAPLTAGTLARLINPAAAHERLSPFVPGTTPEEAGWSTFADRPDFLGNEFLLWLWFLSDGETDSVTTQDGSTVTFMFSGGVRFECPAGQTGNDTINHASGVRTPEARAAVRTGKLPRKAALTVVRHDDQYSFKLDAESLAVSSARLPKPDGSTTGRDRDVERLGHVRDLAEILDQLFAAFLARRLSSYWAGELAEMQAWIKRGRVAA